MQIQADERECCWSCLNSVSILCHYIDGSIHERRLLHYSSSGAFASSTSSHILCTTNGAFWIFHAPFYLFDVSIFVPRSNEKHFMDEKCGNCSSRSDIFLMCLPSNFANEIVLMQLKLIQSFAHPTLIVCIKMHRVIKFLIIFSALGMSFKTVV